jgi:predicted RNase H-like nuclease (RuvC/YqgF family)
MIFALLDEEERSRGRPEADTTPTYSRWRIMKIRKEMRRFRMQNRELVDKIEELNRESRNPGDT